MKHIPILTEFLEFSYTSSIVSKSLFDLKLKYQYTLVVYSVFKKNSKLFSNYHNFCIFHKFP